MARKSRSKNRQVNKKASKRRGLRRNSNKTKSRSFKKRTYIGGGLEDFTKIVLDETNIEAFIKKIYDEDGHTQLEKSLESLENKKFNCDKMEKILKNIDLLMLKIFKEYAEKKNDVHDEEYEGTTLFQKFNETLGKIRTLLENKIESDCR